MLTGRTVQQASLKISQQLYSYLVTLNIKPASTHIRKICGLCRRKKATCSQPVHLTTSTLTWYPVPNRCLSRSEVARHRSFPRAIMATLSPNTSASSMLCVVSTTTRPAFISSTTFHTYLQAGISEAISSTKLRQMLWTALQQHRCGVREGTAPRVLAFEATWRYFCKFAACLFTNTVQ